MRIPEKGIDSAKLLQTLEQYKSNDLDWKSGRTWGYIYDPGEEAMAIGKQAYMSFLTENALDPTAFPSILKLETETVRMVANHLGGDASTVGNFTSGGTESIMMAVKSARDYWRAKKPEITQPEMILPTTAHAAFHKAAHYLDVKVVNSPVDGKTFRADVADMASRVTENTILLVGSAPSYAHGVIDPITEIGQLALEKELLFHVDACVGGFLLPYYKRLGEDLPDYNLSVPGVTTLSVDLHKYAYCPKNASIILYKDKALRKFQIFACASWTGYTVVNPTAGSSKTGGPVAAAWAVLHAIGDSGYEEICRQKLACTKRLIQGVNDIPDIYVQGTPMFNMFCFASDTVSVFHIADEMKKRGWYVQPQLAYANSKENIHLSIGVSNVRWAEELLKDLAECVESAKSLPSGELAATIKETFANMDPSMVSEEVFSQMLGMAGIQGTALPDRMAEINEVLNALPWELREKLLIDYLNDLFQ